MLKKLAAHGLIPLFCASMLFAASSAMASAAPVRASLPPTIVQASLHELGALDAGYDLLFQDGHYYAASAAPAHSTSNTFRTSLSGSGFSGYKNYSRASGARSERTLHWRPNTSLLVSAVPEPTNYSLLAFGLLLVMVAARRQRRFLRS